MQGLARLLKQLCTLSWHSKAMIFKVFLWSNILAIALEVVLHIVSR